MSGSIAHVLGVPITEALSLGKHQMIMLANEAERQRALDTIAWSRAFAGDKDGVVEKALKVHGPYTKGFHEGEWNRLTMAFGGKK